MFVDVTPFLDIDSARLSLSVWRASENKNKYDGCGFESHVRLTLYLEFQNLVIYILLNFASHALVNPKEKMSEVTKEAKMPKLG